MTVTTADPPVVVVCAYLPFVNPLTDDIAPRCSAFRQRFGTYVADLASGTPHRQRSLIIGGDLQVALTPRDESITLTPPGPGSTELERKDHATFVSKAKLIDSYRTLRPTGSGHTCRSTYPLWTRGRSLASKRIDYILSPMRPVRTSHSLIDEDTYAFTDHAAVYAAYSIPSTLPTLPIPKDKVGQGSSAHLNVMLSSRDKLIADILAGNIRKFESPPTVPEDSNVPDAKGLPPMWNEIIARVSTEDSHAKYIAQIPFQVADWVLHDPEFMKILLSPEAMQTFGEPLDGRGILGIPDLELDSSHEIPTSHRARCRDVPQAILPIIEDHLQGCIDKGLFETSNNAKYTSPIVIAKKATAPFFRVAIDYRWINQYICMVQAFTPIIQHELHKSLKWQYFADIDWSEAFHQIRLSPKSSEMLSITTTIGPIRPRFMMEGVSPASSVL